MKSWEVHYKNKYPDSKVFSTESSLDVYDSDGNHAVALRKNGVGQWVDESESQGCIDRHDLAPIPRDARVHKVVNGKIGLDEEAADRRVARRQFLCSSERKVLSCVELKAKKVGWEFDDKGKALSKPAAPQESPVQN